MAASISVDVLQEALGNEGSELDSDSDPGIYSGGEWFQVWERVYEW